jgi:outer membrane protein OmpA-like peptidoglycan-associated protein/opacity protein-like surface antigen
MRLSVKTIATAVFAVFLMPPLLMCADEAAKPSTGAKDDNAADSSVGVAADPAGVSPAALMPASSMAAAMPYARGLNSDTPKAEWFMGYSYLRAVPSLTAGNRMMWLNGGSTSFALNLNRYLGLVGDFGGFNETRVLVTSGNPPTAVGAYRGVDDGTVFTYLFGPRLSYRKHDRITPFVQVLFGGIHASDEIICPNCTPVLPAENSFSMTAGGGLDVKVHHHFAIRVIQAEYLLTNFNDLTTGKKAAQNDMRLSSGIVFRFGGNPPPPVTLACAANPASIFPGDTVTVAATAGHLDPQLNAVYSWTGSGVTGNGSTATVATGSLAPGSYTVKCGVKEGNAGKEGLKPWETAEASASFTVKAFEPPTISCSTSPNTINPGDKAVITAVGVSPQNRPLSYTYSVSAGTVNGNGTTANFDSIGAPSGAITATCTVSDDKDQTATTNTTVTIALPPPPPALPAEQVRLESRLALHSVFFPTAQPRAEHPEGGLVPSQQQTLTTLATDFKSYLAFKADAHLTLSGHADVRGSVEDNQALSERRVARTKQFLVGQGVTEGSIETRGLGKEQELTTDQVKELVEQNPDLSDAERKKVLGDLTVIVLAQNRRVDVTLSTTGQQSVRLYPFNAADSLTLLDKKGPTPRKRAAPAAK